MDGARSYHERKEAEPVDTANVGAAPRRGRSVTLGKMEQRTSSPSQFVDLVLIIGGGALLVWLIYVAADGVWRKDWGGAGAAFAFAVMNGLVCFSAFRRLKAATLRDREIETKDRRQRDWKGDPIE